jgi:RNAse (barnase) inhibitor barstar
VADVVLDGSSIRTTSDFYAQFFAVMEGLMPDYGGRNLDAIHDDLRELTEPLTIRWMNSQESADNLLGLFDSICSVLRSPQASYPITLILE